MTFSISIHAAVFAGTVTGSLTFPEHPLRNMGIQRRRALNYEFETMGNGQRYPIIYGGRVIIVSSSRNTQECFDGVEGYKWVALYLALHQRRVSQRAADIRLIQSQKGRDGWHALTDTLRLV